MTTRSKEKTDDSTSENAEVKTETVKLYNINDGVHGRDGGPYLDQVQDRLAEQTRAFVEGREPDYENPLPSVGTVLVSEHGLVQAYNNTALAGQDKLKFSGEISAPVKAETEVPVVEETDVTSAPPVGNPNPVEVTTQAPPDDALVGEFFPTGKEDTPKDK